MSAAGAIQAEQQSHHLQKEHQHQIPAGLAQQIQKQQKSRRGKAGPGPAFQLPKPPVAGPAEAIAKLREFAGPHIRRAAKVGKFFQHKATAFLFKAIAAFYAAAAFWCLA